jgi:opacity protein-like surface antigen
MRTKGQMFLITATIIIVILVLLRTSVNLPNILQKEKELKTRFEKEFFQNTADELVKVIDISYHQPSKITNNVFNFGNFTRKKMTERLQSFEFLYAGVIMPASSGNDIMNVTIVNLLSKPINATLQLNSLTPINYSQMLDSTSWTTNYSINQGQTYTLIVGYNGTYSENVTIQTKVNKSVYVGFFDITLTGSETTYKDKFQKNYTLP